MKLKSCYTKLLTAVFFTLSVPCSAFAQEYKLVPESEGPTKDSVRPSQENPSSTNENQEIRSTKSFSGSGYQENSAAHDTENKSVKPAIKTIEKLQKSEEKPGKQEEDPLSFNFLYYIIEKFKMSELIE